MKRRDVLKRVSVGAVSATAVLGTVSGTAAAYVSAACYGSTSPPGEMDVYVYPNGSSSNGDKLDRAYQVAKNRVQVLVDEGRVPNGCVYKRTDEAGVDVTFQGSCSAMNDFTTWRENNGYTETGCHLLVAYESIVDGCADGGESFNKDQSAIVEAPGSGDHFASTVAQEFLHNFIHGKLDCVQNETDGSGDEHYLGATNAYGEMTALAKADKYVKNGDCNDSSWSGYTPEMTGCTKRSVECTYNNVS
jgi:hypothetical protein